MHVGSCGSDLCGLQNLIEFETGAMSPVCRTGKPALMRMPLDHKDHMYGVIQCLGLTLSENDQGHEVWAKPDEGRD